jgi:hypothetical protein
MKIRSTNSEEQDYFNELFNLRKNFIILNIRKLQEFSFKLKQFNQIKFPKHLLALQIQSFTFLPTTSTNHIILTKVSILILSFNLAPRERKEQ